MSKLTLHFEAFYFIKYFPELQDFDTRPSGCTSGDHVAFNDANDSSRNPKAIRIGNFEIETWYSAPYPAEYAQLSILYLCEFCMKYMKSLEMRQRHSVRCDIIV